MGDMKNMLIFLNIQHHLTIMFTKFNNFGTQHLNGPRHLFCSFCCTTRHIFEPLRVYGPGFNTDKYGMHSKLRLRTRSILSRHKAPA